MKKKKTTEIGSEGQNTDEWKEEFIKEIYGQTEEVYDDETVTIETYDGIMRQVTTPLGES